MRFVCGHLKINARLISTLRHVVREFVAHMYVQCTYLKKYTRLYVRKKIKNPSNFADLDQPCVY